MPELRKDPVAGRWVIVSQERSYQPFSLRRRTEASELEARRARMESFCPLCPGREAHTPGELLAYGPSGRHPNSPGWRVRVVPNKFPVLRVEGNLDRSGEGLYDRMKGLGAHEVVVDSPAHQMRLGSMSPEQISTVARAWRERIVDLRRDFRLRYVLAYKNEGLAAGATMTHPQSQLIALPVVPRRVADELQGAKRYFDYRERCVFCDMLDQELKTGTRLVYENRGCVVFQPFAARFPFETWVLPRRHLASFQHSPDELLDDLGEALKVALYKLDQALEDPPYSLILHSAPFQSDQAPYYHWHIEIMPALLRVSGFEWGTGFYINPTPPEESARFLREETDLGIQGR